MKRFHFRLQRVLDFRSSVKKEQGQVLSKANATLFEEEKTLTHILTEQEAAQPPTNKVMAMAELSLQAKYQEYLQEALIEQRLLVLEAASAVDAAREAYIEKAREEEALEILKKKRKERHRLEELKRERKKIDEIVVQRHRFTKNN